MLQRDCDVVWPGLVELIEKSLNPDAREQQVEIKVMLAMPQASNSASKCGVDRNWEQVCKECAGPSAAQQGLPLLSSKVETHT